MAVTYQFVMHHSGRLPSENGLGRWARDFQGKLLADREHYTGNAIQGFLDNFYPLFDYLDHTGRKVTTSFDSTKKLDSFRAKLLGIGVHFDSEILS